MKMQQQSSYPPEGLERLPRERLKVVGPKSLKIETYVRKEKEDEGVGGESVWLISPTRKIHLETPALNEGNAFTIDSFAIAPN